VVLKGQVSGFWREYAGYPFFVVLRIKGIWKQNYIFYVYI
jgi:hypothetical protein